MNTPPESTQIAIPLEARTLGEFIANLLGQRRLIERSFSDRRFEIDVNWLLNLDQIIEQRLAAQNAAQLVSFSATFFFANGKIVTVENQLAFRTFHDLSNELSIGVDMKWSYLIKFPLAQLPEKQSIRFLAFSNKTIVERKTERQPSKSFFSIDSEDERLAYSVEFTNVTWGEDVSSHISNYITSKTEQLPKWRSSLRRTRAIAFFPIAMLIALITMMWALAAGMTSVEKIVQQYGPMNAIAKSLSTVDGKLDFLIDLSLMRMSQELPIFVPIIKAIAAYAFTVGLFFILISRKSSFISINDHSARYLARYGRNYDFIRNGVIAALIVGIVASVLANKIYDAIKFLF